MERVRHVPLRTPVPIHVVEGAAFRTAAEGTREEEGKERRARVELFASAFTLVPDGGGLGDRLDHSHDEALGFYSVRDRALFVRRQEAPLDELRTLAHEVEHALQAERVNVEAVSTLGNDAFLAATAVLEGDATLTAAVATAADLGTSFAEVLASASRAEDTMPIRDAAAAAGAPVVTTWTLWPYQRGTAFTADLLRIGGWAAVDAALRTLPATTEQVLHMDKYLAGEPAIPVRTPALPEGWRAGPKGTLGELTTAVFLAECMPEAYARVAATGWGGDAYVVATKRADTGLLWTTAWDDEASALRFVRALEARRACKGHGAKPPFIAVREGSRVAFLQNVPDGEGLATSMLEGVGDRPLAAPPFSGRGSRRARLSPRTSWGAARSSATSGRIRTSASRPT